MKILTALNNAKLHKKLVKEFEKSEYLIFEKDIMYKEGIIEFLKNKSNDNNINLIIINTKINGNIDIYSLIKEILEIDKFIEIIIIIDEEDLNLRKFLTSFNINKFLIEGKFNFEDLILLITNDNSIKQKSLEKELEELRSIIFNKEQNTLKNKIFNKFNNISKVINTKSKGNKKNRENTKNNNKSKESKNKEYIKSTKSIKNNNKTKRRHFKNKIYLTLSEDIQKYNIDSIDITINIRK